MIVDKVMIAVSYEGDELERPVLRELARRHDTTVGHLVREAVEALHGDEMQDLRPFFAARGSAQKHQADRKRSGQGR